MSKILEKILQDFKKANKAAKEKMAAKFGFKTPAELEAHLTGTPKVETSKKSSKKADKTAKVVERITVHNVHILDASGSMHGGKINAALKGINMEVEDMKKDNSTEVTQTIVHFSDPMDIQTFCWKTPLGEVKHFSTLTRGSTALLQTIGNTLTQLLSEANGKDKVLVKIFTDGQENATSLDSPWRNPKAVSDLIKQCESKGFTITFVGTEQDVKYVINLLSIDKTNTLAHQNTAESIGATYLMSQEATVKYRGAAARGQDVTHDFFTKETGTL